jgi:hypothetical protein
MKLEECYIGQRVRSVGGIGRITRIHKHHILMRIVVTVRHLVSDYKLNYKRNHVSIYYPDELTDASSPLERLARAAE